MNAADFLVELGTEELPPKALRKLRDAFAASLASGLDAQRLEHGDVAAYASPRRLALIVSALATGQPDKAERKKGPPVRIAIDEDGKPTKAGLAFADKCGVDFESLDREQTDKGEWLACDVVDKGQATADLLPEIVNNALAELPIPRRMRWGDGDTEFVRPVHWLTMLHGEDIVAGSVLGIESGRLTYGHRFMAPGALPISDPSSYLDTLREQGYVVADFDARREAIVEGVTALASVAGGEPVGGDELFDEVTALTEWPVPMTGSFDKSFLEMPPEVIVSSLTGHQRYFPVVSAGGELLPVFITVANLESKEPDRVRHGNERVIQPRLADAAFFWKTDRQVTLADRAAGLGAVVYQQGLGSIADKAERIAGLAQRLAVATGEDSDVVGRAARLAKADLLSGMVGEFPELQGVMGGYYATASDEPEAVARAIGEHYLPRFAGDDLPATPAGRLLAVADRLDSLAGIFALGKKPSGNRDPFGLRRAALGIVRILVEHSLEVDFQEALGAAVAAQPVDDLDQAATVEALYEFVIDRLRGYYLDQDDGITIEMFEAVRVRRPVSLSDFDQRLKAVAEFSRHESAASLAAANKRTANILRQAEGVSADTLDPTRLGDGAEAALYGALQAAERAIEPLLAERSYTAALEELAGLREPVDNFFDEVLVMSEDEGERRNRLSLLAGLRALFLNIADVSRLPSGQD